MTTERITKEQVFLIINGLNSKGKYLDGLFVSSCFHLGRRGGDILNGLKHEHFDGEHFYLKEEKTSKYTELTIHPMLRKQYELYMRKVGKHSNSEYIFTNRSGNILTLRGYNLKIKEWKVDFLKNKCGNLSSHSFRKSFGYNQKLQGTPIHEIQKMFNHKSEGQTLDYVGITSDNIRKNYLK